MASRQPVMEDLEKVLIRSAEAYIGGRPFEREAVISAGLVCQMLTTFALLDLADQAEALNANMTCLINLKANR